MKKIIDNDAKLVQSAFRKLHKKIFDNFDLGSPKMLFLTISKDAGMLFNTKDLSYKKVKAETLGKEIAETILLSLECSNVEFGDWINKQSLPNLKVIEKLDSEDFYLDVELKKFWIMARIICNKIINEKDNNIYVLSYDSDSGMTYHETFKTLEDFKEYSKNNF